MSSIKISGKTQLIGLLGSPVSGSKSPAMQTAAFAAAGIDLVYLSFDVTVDRLEDAINGVRALGMRGCNVTMPLKRKVGRFLDELSPAAQHSGSVNTIVNENGKLVGHTTDGVGLMRALTDAGIKIKDAKLTIAGAGGAASAVAYQAALDGASAISIFNSRDSFFADGEAIVADIHQQTGCDARLFELGDINSLGRELTESTVFVNGTPLGMSPNEDTSVITDSFALPPELVVADMVYIPSETRLLRLAACRGCRTINGVGMALYQGAASFKLWTGLEMPLDVARRALLDGGGT